MIKKEYKKPTVKVVQLKYKCHILSGSPETLQGHSKSGEETEDTWYELE